MSAILSFLGGAAFRMIWGQLADVWTKWQDHAHEQAMLKLQGELDDKRHARDCDRIRLQSELGVKEVMVQADADIARIEANAFLQATSRATEKTGIWLVDLWNGVIRPAAASLALYLWVVALNTRGWTMTDWDRELVGVIIGFYFATRVMNRDKRAN
jgi:hypothetical protein